MEPLPRRKRATDAKCPVKYVIVGGGIAGVSCAQELRRLNADIEVTILTESDTIVAAASIFRVTEHLDELSVYERSTDSFRLENPRIEIKKCTVLGIDYDAHHIFVKDRTSGVVSAVPYDKLCLCVGARPRKIAEHPRIIGLRDQLSVEDLLQRLRTASRVAVVGNGGIALELIHELRLCEVDWIVKDNYIGSAFFDASASAFILPSLHARASVEHGKDAAMAIVESGTENAAGAPLRQGCDFGPSSATSSGSALGPEWISKTAAKVFLQERKHLAGAGALKLHFQQEVQDISADGGATWVPIMGNSLSPTDRSASSGADYSTPLYLRTTTGEVVVCDFVVSATGVESQNTVFLHSVAQEGVSGLYQPTSAAAISLQCSAEGYICTDSVMRTSVRDVYAAGDCCQYNALCTPGQAAARASHHFFQMRLWTQAHWMGVYAAQSMLGRADDFGVDTKFELFTHITRFFGHKVVMLGRYNAQGLGKDTEVVTKGLIVTDEGVKLMEPATTTSRSGDATDSALTDILPRSTAAAPSSSSAARSNQPAPAPVEIWVRVTPGREYIKLTILRGKLVGALLIGDTELEEVFENLILNALDISGIGIGLLDPDVDIADYFD